MENGSADSAYYNFIDRFDMLGVGKDVPLATGNLSEGLLMLVDGKFMTLRVPYPMGYYAKRLDGRIDDPKAGWKGKGIYTPISTRAHSTWKAAKGVSAIIRFSAHAATFSSQYSWCHPPSTALLRRTYPAGRR